MPEQIMPLVPFSSALVWRREQRPAVPLRIHMSFTPNWFADRMELDYGERWHTDPFFRRESFVAMARALNKEFPALRLGGDPESLRGDLNQIYTCCLMGAVFGQEIVYYKGTWPDNRGKPFEDDPAAEELQVPAFRNLKVFEVLMKQMDVIEREWGAIEGDLNYQGILNIAFRIRGEKIFSDMYEAPNRVHHVLSVVGRTLQEVVDTVFERQRRSGARRDYFVTSNCVVNMISGDSYREFLLPYDRELSDHYSIFGVHNCGWNVDAYTQPYSEIRALDYLDFGITSDLPRIKRLCPTALLNLILNPEDVLHLDSRSLRAMLDRVHGTLGFCRITLGSMDTGTPPKLIEEFFRTAAEVWGVPVEALIPE
jgi:hypothetical protein